MLESFISVLINGKNKATAVKDPLFLVLSEEKKQYFCLGLVYFVPEQFPCLTSSVGTSSVNEVLMCM